MYCEILCFRIMGWFISHLWVNCVFIFRPEISRPVPRFPENFPTRPEFSRPVPNIPEYSRPVPNFPDPSRVSRIFPTRPEFPDNLHLCYN